MGITIVVGSFEWDEEKEAKNRGKHGVGFLLASRAFLDPSRVLAVDELHSDAEPRHFCIGHVGDRILTVRFTYRGNRIRILGAGYWRKGRAVYEKENEKN